MMNDFVIKVESVSKMKGERQQNGNKMKQNNQAKKKLKLRLKKNELINNRQTKSNSSLKKIMKPK